MESLLELAFLLFGVTIGGMLFKKLHQPSITGELIAGIILGPSFLGIVTPSTLIGIIADLGLIFLILLISLGLEWRRLEGRAEQFVWTEIVRAALAGGVGYLIGLSLGFDFYTSVVFSVIMAVSSTAIVSRTLVDLKRIDKPEAEDIMGLQIVDEVVAIVAVAMLASFLKGNPVGLEVIFSTVFLIVGFFVVMSRIGFRFINTITSSIQKYGIEDALFGFTLLFALLLAGVTEAFNLSTVLGVFIAGMILSRSAQKSLIAKKVKDLGENLFIPVFFGAIGLKINMFTVESSIMLIFSLIVISIFLKFFTAYAVMKFSPFRENGRKIASTFVTFSEMTLVIAALGFTVINPSIFVTFIVVFIIVNAISPLLIALAFRFDGGNAGKRRWPRLRGRMNAY